MKSSKQPRFYFSFRSPYSWLAYRDLMASYPDVASRLTWIPFWEPDELSLRMLAEVGGKFPYVENSRPKARYILQDVRRLARERGLTVTWPVDRQPCWEVSHLGYLVALRNGRGPEFIARVYRARWEEQRDISDRVTIAAIATEMALDPVEFANAADDPDLRAQGVEALLSIDADGVFGVPFFVHGYEKYWGIDRIPSFMHAFYNWQLPAVAGPPQGGDETDGPHAGRLADQGHAGGCG
jgi:2-hydroxychromene-2-carboxylate isomerase